MFVSMRDFNIVALILSAAIGLAPICLAANPSDNQAFVISHTPPLAEKLPVPALLMTLAVELKNVKQTSLPVRLIANRDGTILDIALPPGFLNEQDNALYQVKLPSPSAFISYQFIVEDNINSPKISKRYTVRRSCIPKLSVAVPDGSPDQSFRYELGTLLTKAKQLERDTQNYETALALLNDIKSVSEKEQ